MKKKAFSKSVFAVPYMFICAIFVIFPLILVLIYAFQGADGKFTFDNFIQVFTNSTNYILILKTVGIAILATAITLLIAYPIALVLSSSGFNKYAIIALLFIVPMWMNFILRIYALQTLLNMLGIAPGLFSAVVGIVYDFLPFMLLPIYTILVNMDKSYIEASYDLGLGTVRTFFKVTLPLSVPGIVSGTLMVFMPIFSAYAITDILGGTEANVIGGKINYLVGNNQWGLGSALAFVLLLLVFATMFIGNLITKRKTKVIKVTAGMGGGGIL